MKLEVRTKEFYRSAFNTSPKLECLLQNQLYMFECILEILDRLDWRGPVKERKSEEMPKFDFDKKTGKLVPTGEPDFKKQAKEITGRAKKNIEEEPL